MNFIFYGFPTQFFNRISKIPTLCNAKILNQEGLSFVDPILQGANKALFFTSNGVILQSTWSAFFLKILNFLKRNSIHAICIESDSYGVFFYIHSQGIYRD
jgi:hypothetical protein